LTVDLTVAIAERPNLFETIMETDFLTQLLLDMDYYTEDDLRKLKISSAKCLYVKFRTYSSLENRIALYLFLEKFLAAKDDFRTKISAERYEMVCKMIESRINEVKAKLRLMNGNEFSKNTVTIRRDFDIFN
jgi:hypothetical protein